MLGGIYAALVFVLSLIAGAVVDMSALLPILLKEETLTAEAVRQLYYALLIGALLYTPIAMMFWFAPLLAAWHGVPPVKAMFFSWTACWRNRGAFFTYVVLFAVLLVAIPFFLETIFSAFGAETVLSFLVTPYSLLMLAILYCSFYATYRGCFNVVPAEQEQGARPEPKTQRRKSDCLLPSPLAGEGVGRRPGFRSICSKRRASQRSRACMAYACIFQIL